MDLGPNILQRQIINIRRGITGGISPQGLLEPTYCILIVSSEPNVIHLTTTLRNHAFANPGAEDVSLAMPASQPP